MNKINEPIQKTFNIKESNVKENKNKKKSVDNDNVNSMAKNNVNSMAKNNVNSMDKNNVKSAKKNKVKKQSDNPDELYEPINYQDIYLSPLPSSQSQK